MSALARCKVRTLGQCLNIQITQMRKENKFTAVLIDLV
jgi:hypothetical protein